VADAAESATSLDGMYGVLGGGVGDEVGSLLRTRHAVVSVGLADCKYPVFYLCLSGLFICPEYLRK
jgi:hypothetical protein